MNNIFQQYGIIEKIGSAVVDGGSNMRAAIEVLNNKKCYMSYNIQIFSCLNHLINTILKKFLGESINVRLFPFDNLLTISSVCNYSFR